MASPHHSSRSPSSEQNVSTDSDLKTNDDLKTSDVEPAPECNYIVEEPEDEIPNNQIVLYVSQPQNIPGKGVNHVDGNKDVPFSKKFYGGGTPGARRQEVNPRGCSECEETDSEDDDICSSTSEESEDLSSPPASMFQRPMLPDVQLRVPMMTEDDVRKVRQALQIKGVLEVVCDIERQIVTVTGNVPPSRLLKKVKKVKRNSRILSYMSPLSPFPRQSNTFDMPSSLPIHPFAFHQRPPRPTYQSYTFHNSPHSPYLRNYCPSDLSAPNSPPLHRGDGFDLLQRRYPFFEDDYYFPSGRMGMYY